MRLLLARYGHYETRKCNVLHKVPPLCCAMGGEIDFVYLVATMPGRRSEPVLKFTTSRKHQQTPLLMFCCVRYGGKLVSMAARLKDLQGLDGCWRPSLDDPTEFSSIETTGTSLFVFGMASVITLPPFSISLCNAGIRRPCLLGRTPDGVVNLCSSSQSLEKHLNFFFCWHFTA